MNVDGRPIRTSSGARLLSCSDGVWAPSIVRSPGEAETRERFVELRLELERLDEKPFRLDGSLDPMELPGSVLLGSVLLERPLLELLVPNVAIGELLGGNVLELSA